MLLFQLYYYSNYIIIYKKETMKEEEDNQIVESAANLPKKKRCNLNDYAVPLTLNVGMLPTKSDVNKKW